MEYSKIISVTGLSGLFELLSSKADGAIVRSLEDKGTRFVSSRIHNFSHLESIEIFTVKENVNLAEVLIAIQNSAHPLPGDKDGAAVKKFFEDVYPDMDFERVYMSDMKKILKWFGILKANNIEIKIPQQEEEANAGSSAIENEEVKINEEPAEEVASSPGEKELKTKKAKPAAKKDTAKKEAPKPEEGAIAKKKAAAKKKTKE
ncbi:MAG: DUF5606 domain-containing protein [Chitinophagaceae bacterium]|nr:DUF5606 domain-containing protein [Chitinophagaceae bacterium]